MQALIGREGGEDLPQTELLLRGGPLKSLWAEIEVRKEIKPAGTVIQKLLSLTGGEEFLKHLFHGEGVVGMDPARRRERKRRRARCGIAKIGEQLADGGSFDAFQSVGPPLVLEVVRTRGQRTAPDVAC